MSGTYTLSGKMLQIAREPCAAVCGEWFTAHGTGKDLGYVCAPENAETVAKLCTAFAAWYYAGHINESDPNTCILRGRLTDAVLMAEGKRHDIDFTAEQAGNDGR